MTNEELEEAVKKARESIKNDPEESERFAFFQDFQGKLAHDIIQVIHRNTDLMLAGGYQISGPRNAAGYWAVYTTAIATAMSVGTFLTSLIYTKLKKPGYECIDIKKVMDFKEGAELITANSLADITGHALMQCLNTHHDLKLPVAGAADFSKQLSEAIKPLLEALLESKKVKVKN